MQLDEFYINQNKGNYYLGLVSSVNRKSINLQIENFSLLNPRLLAGNNVVPNTIDYYVVIESVTGLFIGNVFQTSVKNSDNVHRALDNGKNDEILPDIQLELLGFKPNFMNKFELPGFNNVGVGDKVYVANEEILSEFLLSNDLEEDTKIFPTFAKLCNLTDVDFKIGLNTLLNRHLLVIGSTGSGKSTSALSLLEKMLEIKKKFIIVDPTGEYKEAFSDKEVCKLTLGKDTTISTGELSMPQWMILFEVNDGTQPAVLADAIKSLRYQKKGKFPGVYQKVGRKISVVQNEMTSLMDTDTEFESSSLAEQITAEAVKIGKNDVYEVDSFRANVNHFLVQKIDFKLKNTNLGKFFNNNGLNNLLAELDSFLSNNSRLYIDSSQIGTDDGVGGMIIDLITNYLLNHANKNKPFVFFIDEAHRYTRNMNSENNEFFTGLTSIAREGRKNGQYLMLTTQNPSDVSKVLLAQMGSLLIHRLTHQDELNAISNFLDNGTQYQIKKLGQGEAVLTSANLLQNVFLKINKSKRKHLNDSPKL